MIHYCFKFYSLRSIHITLIIIYLSTVLFMYHYSVNIFSYTNTIPQQHLCVSIHSHTEIKLITPPTRIYGNFVCPFLPRFLAPPRDYNVALVSYPGSGNTWVRYLLEQSTGFYTGSVYRDKLLSSRGFKEKVYNGSVVAIKTHESWGKLTRFRFTVLNYSRAILIVRHPRAAMIAEMNRYFGHGQHTTVMQNIRWSREKIQNKMLEYINGWKNFIVSWSEFSEPILIVKFENLLNDWKVETLRMIAYLNLEPITHGVKCLEHDSDGYFKRPISNLQPFISEEVHILIKHCYNTVKPYLSSHNITYLDI